MTEPLLEVTQLRKYFPVRAGGLLRRTVGQLQAVDGISFSLGRGRSLGLVGESGSGKTTTARLVTRLLEPTSGSIRFAGREVTGLGRRELLPFRRQVQMVFQDPYGSLNPRHSVGTIVATPLRVHDVVPPARVPVRVGELLEQVGLSPADGRRYPHELSGGQRQRVGIARALALEPSLLVADEPVSALDPSIQAQVLNLLQDLQQQLGVGYLFISHDLGVVRHLCPDVAVMYLGKIVETGPRDRIYAHAHHPYTQALLAAVPTPRPGEPTGTPTGGPVPLHGDPPSPVHPPSGCRFRTRCPRAQQICAAQDPPLVEVAPGQRAACHFAGEVGAAAGTPVTQRVLGVDERGLPRPHHRPSPGD